MDLIKEMAMGHHRYKGIPVRPILTALTVYAIVGGLYLQGAETIGPEDERMAARIRSALLASGAPETWPADVPPLSDLINAPSNYRRMVTYFYIYKAIEQSNSVEVRIKLTQYLCLALADETQNQSAVKRLAMLNKDDFSAESTKLIDKYFQVRFYDDEILLAGILGQATYGKKIKKIALSAGPIFFPEYNANLVAALAVLARWGDEAAFDRLIIDVKKLPPERLYLGSIQKLEYVLNAQGIGYFLSLLKSRENIDEIGSLIQKNGSEVPSAAKFAAISLSRMLAPFPIKSPPDGSPFALCADSELDACRVWVSEQDSFRTINGVTIPVREIHTYPRSAEEQ